MQTGQVTPFFSYTFSLFVKLFFAYENNQNSFSCAPPLNSILVREIPQFWTRTKDGLRIPKIYIMFCSPNGAEKIYQLMA